MKDTILIVIGILTFAAIAIMMTACQNSEPISAGGLEQCRTSLAESIESEESAWAYVSEIENNDTDTGTVATENEFATIDWQARAEKAEKVAIECTTLVEIKDAQYSGLYDAATEYRNALRYFDLKQPCDDGLIDYYICRAFFDGNL